MVKELRIHCAAATIAAHSSDAARRTLGSPAEPTPATDTEDEKSGTLAREPLRSFQIKG